MRRRTAQGIALLLAAMMLAGPVGCATSESEDTLTLKVVTTIPPVADFVRLAGREHIDVTLMVPAGASPHTYEPTPGQMVEVSKADVYMKVGSGVEFEIVWLDKLLAQNKDVAVVDCSQGIAIVDNDPHIWTSPILAMQMVRNIVDGLSSVDPVNSESYRENGESYMAELSNLNDQIVEQFSGASNRLFLIYHPSFAYFAAQYDLVQLAIEHDGKPPTPQVLQASIDAAREHNLHYVFVAPQFAANDALSVAAAIGGEVAFLDPLPDSYIPAMRETVAAIALDVK